MSSMDGRASVSNVARAFSRASESEGRSVSAHPRFAREGQPHFFDFGGGSTSSRKNRW